MAIGEILSVALELNVQPWVQGMSRAQNAARVAMNQLTEHQAFLQTASQRLGRALSRDAVIAGQAINTALVAPVKILGQTFEVVATAGSRSFQILGEAALGVASVISGAFSKLPLLGVEKGFGVGGGLIQSLLGGLGGAGNVASSMISALGSVRTAVTTFFSGLFEGIAKGIGAGIQTVISTIVNTITGVFLGGPLGGILSFFGSIVDGMSRFVSGFVGGIANGISGALTAVGKAVESIAQGAMQALTSLREIAAQVINVVTDVAGFMSQKASDLVEEANKFNVAFRQMAGGVNAGLTAFGATVSRSQLDLMNFAGTVQSTLMTMGFARDEAAGFSEKITKLSVDLGSFFNVADAKAFQGLESGIMGNHRALRQFGIGINQSTLGMELFSMGLGRTAKTYAGAVQLATEYEKATARLNIILRQTTEIQGDAERNANSFANTMKRVEAMVGDLASAIGQELNKEIANFFNVTVDGATGMDHLRTIMYAVFIISKDLAKELAKTAFAFVKMLADGIIGLGGVAGVVARVRIGIEYIRQGAMLVQAAWTMLGPVWPSLVNIITNSVKAIAAGLTFMEASAQRAFAVFMMSATPVVNQIRRVVGWLMVLNDMTAFAMDPFGVNRSIANALEGTDAVIDAGAQDVLRYGAAAAAAGVRAAAAMADMRNATSAVTKEVTALSEYTAWAFATLAGETTRLAPMFTEYGSVIANSFIPVQYEINSMTFGLRESEQAILSLEKQVAISSQEMLKWFDAVGNQFDFLRRSGALSVPGAEMSAGDGPSPAPSGGLIENILPGGNVGGRYASGGVVVGPPGHDRVPARLTAGEFVVPAGAASQNRAALEAMRQGKRARGSGVTQNTTIILPQVRSFNADTYERQIKPAQARAARRTLPRKGN